MGSFFTRYISVFLFLGLLVVGSPLRTVEDTRLLGAKYFKVRIKIPGNPALSGKHYMDTKNGFVGFGRGGEIFEAVSRCKTNESRKSYVRQLIMTETVHQRHRARQLLSHHA